MASKNTQKTEKAWNGLYVHRAARDGGNLMPCSLIHVCVWTFRPMKMRLPRFLETSET